MFRETCRIVAQEKTAPGHFVLTLESPKISKNARPGQFVQVLCADISAGTVSLDPLLPRPFSFLTADSKNFSLLYQVVGKGTSMLSALKKGQSLSVLGPCGNGFGLPAQNKITRRYLIGGGVGIPPLYHFSQELLKKKVPAKNIHVFLGARDKSLLLCEKEFKKLGITLHLATDNGSRGTKGFVTQALEEFLKKDGTEGLKLYTCGPTPMMKAVTGLSEKYKVPCEVSVEVPMACGFGACLGCAVKVRDGHPGGHRHAIACCEGPVFAGDAILWD